MDRVKGVGEARLSPVSRESWLPRLTGRAMGDLRIWLWVCGLFVGLGLPYAVMTLGVPAERALSPIMFAATVSAGILLGDINYCLARGVVGGRVHGLASAMRHVEQALADGDFSGSRWPVVSATDEFAQLTGSFDRLVGSLAGQRRVAGDTAAVAASLAAHLELDALATVTLRELADRVGCAGAALLCVYNGRVLLAGSTGIANPDRLTEAEVVHEVFSGGKRVTIELPEDVIVTAALVDARPRLVQALPLLAGARVVGVLLLSWLQPPAAQASDVVAATLPGLAVALNNALTHEDLQRVAGLDPLTGVYNRRFGLQRLNEEFSRSARSGDPLGVLMMDLDHFKAVNDTYGHVVGDRVLQAVIWSARGVLREGDVLVRYGGEEFLIVLPGAGCADISATAERVRRAISQADIVEGGQRIRVTVSIGGAGLPHPQSESPADLLNLADQAVYSAKTYGRDRCVIA